ncbi:zinc finger protein 660-like [Ochlerotatus camptorhynchus]|uniref:zinc finger protein 660-like n=1 Tax=Ochlerotatus camptorhynchus TaxID=644619 RepID=UPI0031D1374B
MATAACDIKKEKSAESICRLCFTERDNYLLIFENKYSMLAERIENITNLKIIQVPNAPAALCLECENTLQSFESFREMCFTNDRVIKEMFPHDDSRNCHKAILDNMSAIAIGSQVDNTDITIEYSDIKIENITTLDSNDIDDDKEKENKLISDTGELLNLEKSESRVETVSKKKKRHICRLCDKGFKNATRLKIHVLSHTQERPHRCKDCGKSFITPSSLKVHMRTHSGLKPYSCDRCQGKFSQASSLIRHNRVHLKEDLISTKNIAEEEEEIEEEEEVKNMEKTVSLLEPMNANGKIKKRCKVCNKFVLKLADHQVIHWETRPYQCEYCPKGFNQRYKLTTHIRTHTNEKPHVCSQCDKRFTNPADLKIHIRSHTQERPFKCKNCNKSFITSGHLLRHAQTHSGLKRYSCDICEAKFSQNTHLLRHKQVHLKKHHKKTP